MPNEDAERNCEESKWKRSSERLREEGGCSQREKRPDVSPEEVVSLIEEARNRALEGQGSFLEPTSGNSHFAGNSTEKPRESVGEVHCSQFLQEEVKKRIEEVFARVVDQKSSEACTVGDLGSLVSDALMLLESQPSCRPRSKAGCKDIFPLPVKCHHSLGMPEKAWLPATSIGLNSLAGADVHSPVEKTSPGSARVLKRLASALKGSPLLGTSLSGVNFDRFFDTKTLDYSGEEVKLAQKVTWKSISPSLPPQVAQLNIEDFCEGGVLHYVTHIHETLLPEEDQRVGRAPTVMVDNDQWEELATNLVRCGLCKVIPKSQVFHINNTPLLNGLFSVGKDEVKDGVPVGRLIMNLKPWNAISRSLSGDVSTLPMITNMGALYLHDSEVLLASSEDLRCFYLFRVPMEWEKFLTFGKQAPRSLVPRDAVETEWYLTGQVLPMGYLNSVGIAQHIHRCVIRRAIGSLHGLGCTVQELRRDRNFTSFPNWFRVYLDNFDQLQRVDRQLATLVAGTPSDLATQIREYYDSQGLPRHPKKSVCQAMQAEIQGAWLDGSQGILCAKPSKVVKYIELALETLRRGKASARELQVIGGGFVYAAMFKRPLLASLNQIWRAIVEQSESSPFRRYWMKKELMIELFRFISLVPLAFNNFRAPFDCDVTASDASTSGGGVCVSRGLTPYGQAACLSQVRGDIMEEGEVMQVLSIGLFDGIAALRVALDLLGAPVCGHVSAEQNPEAQRVVEANFPDSVLISDVEEVSLEMVRGWALRFTCAALVLVGAGPPCQGVSGLNFDRKGALRDARSRLFTHVPRIVKLCRICFPWAQVHYLNENVASMDAEDCEVMNAEFELRPWYADANLVSLAHRPRLYWITWEIQEGEGVEIYLGSEGKLPLEGEVQVKADVVEKSFLEKGCSRVQQKPFPTFTTARPSAVPMRKPAGLKDCSEHEVQRWKEHRHVFPPYQFKDCHCVCDAQGKFRPPSVSEREAILGFPAGYTVQCLKKSEHGSQRHEDCRLSLLGNSWSVPIVSWFLSQLLVRLGIVEPMTPQELVNKLTPGQHPHLQGLLLRPPLGQGNQTFSPNEQLIAKLCGLVSLKGEDLLLQSSTEVPVRYHRLRASLPAKLWRWKTVSGWKWSGDIEHINTLEARAVLTSIKWRVLQKKQTHVRYQQSLKLFFTFLQNERLELPNKREGMDNLVSDYLEFMWAEGEGRAAASTFLAGLQDYDPKLKNCLPGSWRLLKTWAVHETPNRAPPLTEEVLRAMVGWSVLQEKPTFGLSLLVAFYGLLRQDWGTWKKVVCGTLKGGGPPFSRRMVMALTFSLDLGWASANIQPQKVPLEMVPAVDPAASENVHMPIPLASAWAALAPSIRAQDSGDDHDLAEAIRLSLTPARAPAVSERRPKSGKEQLEKRTKDLFELYRSQGVAPHEAAQRAAAQARRETAG
eukprot:s619_g9.t1